MTMYTVVCFVGKTSKFFREEFNLAIPTHFPPVKFWFKEFDRFQGMHIIIDGDAASTIGTVIRFTCKAC